MHPLVALIYKLVIRNACFINPFYKSFRLCTIYLNINCLSVKVLGIDDAVYKRMSVKFFAPEPARYYNRLPELVSEGLQTVKYQIKQIITYFYGWSIVNFIPLSDFRITKLVN